MPDVMKNFIAPLLTQFRVPQDKEADEDAFFQDYRDCLVYCSKDGELVPFEDEVLLLAAKKLKTERTGSRTFPLPGECINACKEARNELHRAAMAREKIEERDIYADWSEKRVRTADALLNSDIGRRAAEQGWHWTLWDFYREKQRQPLPHECDKMRKHVVKRDAETREFLVSQRRITPATEKLLLKMEARKEELRKIAFGEDMARR